MNTSPDIVDDACNFAWSEFIRCQPDRQRSWRSWLITTAQREAWKLHAKEKAHVGFEVADSDELVHEPVDPRDTLTLRSELRAALDGLAAVPARRREVKALQVTGFTYQEIGDLLGLGPTRVNALVVEPTRRSGESGAASRRHLRATAVVGPARRASERDAPRRAGPHSPAPKRLHT